MKFHKEKLNLRLYQQAILATAAKKNTLVILPTGLGKTFIAVALAGLRMKGSSKILILAPTKPLVNQHLRTFSEFFDSLIMESKSSCSFNSFWISEKTIG